MSFDVEAGRAVIREAKNAAERSGPDANVVYPVIDALSYALDEVTRLTNTLRSVHVALRCPQVFRPEPAAPVEKSDQLGRVIGMLLQSDSPDGPTCHALDELK